MPFHTPLLPCWVLEMSIHLTHDMRAAYPLRNGKAASTEMGTLHAPTSIHVQWPLQQVSTVPCISFVALVVWLRDEASGLACVTLTQITVMQLKSTHAVVWSPVQSCVNGESMTMHSMSCTARHAQPSAGSRLSYLFLSLKIVPSPELGIASSEN